MKKSLLIPVAKELQGQAKMIAKSAGLSLLKPKFFNYDFDKAAIESAAYEPGGSVDHFDYTGMLGLPVFDSVLLESPSYKDNAGNSVKSVTLILDIALIDVISMRHIVTTDIVGRNGSVKEYISDGDADITIKGVLVSDVATVAPYNLIKDFNAIATCPETIKVESNFLSYFKISSLVVTKLTVKQKEGSRNIVEYELKCISDTPFELKNA